MNFLEFLRDWSEVWAFLIPLAVIIIYKPKGKKILPLIIYVILGFILNFLAIFMIQYYTLMPSWVNNNNNILYNLHSFARVIFFSWYIIGIRSYRHPEILKGVLITYLLFVLMNFIFLEPVLFLSSHLYAAESFVMLFMCLFYFFQTIQDESRVNWLRHPSFLLCVSISLYEIITFFIFLFFYALHQSDRPFAHLTMRIYTIMFVLLCIMLAVTLYQSRKNKPGLKA